MAEPAPTPHSRNPGGAVATDPGATGAGVIHEIFLSPRVVDREAFNDFSASLRRLIEEAGEQAASLRSAGEAATGAQQALKDLSGKHQPKLEAAVKALSLLDQRAQDAERITQAARDASAALEAVRREGQEIVSQRQRELAARADELTQGLERRFAELEAGAEAATRQQAEIIEQRIAHAEARLTRKSAELDAWAADVLRRAELAVEGERQRAGSAATGQELIRQTADAHAQAQAIGAELSALIARAEALVADHGADSLRAAIAQASDLHERAGRTLVRLESLSTQPPTPASPPATAVPQATEMTPEVDHLSEVAERLRESVQRTLDLAGTAEDRLVHRQAEFKAAIREPVHELQTKSAEVRRDLTEALARIEHERTLAGSLSDQTAAVLRHLSALVREIEPWKPILLGGVTQGELPAPLRTVVERARADLAKDVARVTALLSKLIPEG